MHWAVFKKGRKVQHFSEGPGSIDFILVVFVVELSNSSGPLCEPKSKALGTQKKSYWGGRENVLSGVCPLREAVWWVLSDMTSGAVDGVVRPVLA